MEFVTNDLSFGIFMAAPKLLTDAQKLAVSNVGTTAVLQPTSKSRFLFCGTP
jgi:hypothetical protein